MPNSGDEQARAESEKTWGAHIRATAQSAILINGGAATAVLASFSKDASSSLMRVAALALLLYAAGVVAGAVCMSFVAQSAAWLSSYWANRADRESNRTLNSDYQKFEKYIDRAKKAFMVSLGIFFAASATLTVGVFFR